MERKSIIRAGVLAAIGAGVVALIIAGNPAVSTKATATTTGDRAPGYVRYVPDNLFAVSFRGANNGWAAGYYGTLLQTTDGGKTWVRRPLKSNDLIRRVRFLNDHEGWAVSHRGSIFHTEDGGSNWTVQHQVPDVYLRDIVMVDGENGWAVGHKKTILHTTNGGRNWTPQTFAHRTQDPPRLNGVAAFDAMNAIAVGEFGVIVRTHDGGATWTQIPSPAQTTYTAVAAAGDHAIAVGLTGYLTYIPRDGGAPKVIPTPAPLHVLDIALDPAGNGFAVGVGCAYRISGDTATPVKIDVPQGADQVWFGGVTLLPNGRAMTVGLRGLMARYDPGKQEFAAMADWSK